MSILTAGQQGDASSGNQSGSGDAGQAGNQPDWRSALPDDLRSEKVFESIKGKDWSEAGPILAKNYVHSQRMVGADKIVIPGEKATPEERAEFFKKLGRPDKADEYQFKLPDGLKAEGLDQGRIDKWRGKMHELGLSKAAAETILSEFIADEYGAGQAKAQSETKQLQDWELALKTELGAKFDEKTNIARWAAKEYGNPDLLSFLDQSGLGSHPEVVKMFVRIGEAMSDDRARGGQGGPGGQGFAPASREQAQHALNEFNRNERNMKALFDKQHPDHDRVVKERAELFAIAFPREPETT